MQNEKEKWIEDVLSSTDGMRSADVPDMSDEIMSNIADGQNSRIGKADMGMIWRIAASVVLLLAINSLTVYSCQNRMADMSHHRTQPDVSAIFGLSQGSNGDPGAMIFGN